jgi:O-antigen/teichoic acid export membrane protein
MLRTILDFAWPFVAITIFSVVIANVDTIMLGQIKSTTEVGLYAAAERIVQFLSIIPIFIGLSTFPLMSKSEGDLVASARIFEKIMTTILAIGFPIAIGGLLLSQPLMATIFGPSYRAGGVVLGILMLSVFADFPNLILSNVIFVKNLQKKFIIATAVGVVVNVLFNLYLIPRYGAVGAAISTGVCQFFIMAINWQMLKRYFTFSVVPKLDNIVFASFVMAIIVFACNVSGVYFAITVVLAIASYAGILYLLKEPALAELLSVIHS